MVIADTVVQDVLVVVGLAIAALGLKRKHIDL